MGLKHKTGLLFVVALAIFIGLVIFGNLITIPAVSTNPPASRHPPLAEADQAPTARSSSGRYFNPLTNNLTKELAGIIGRQVAELNPQGPTAVSGQEFVGVAEAEKVAQAVIEEALKNFDSRQFRPEIAIEQLKVDSNQTEANYRQQLTNILQENFSGDLNWQNASADNLARLLGNYNVLLFELYRLPVPTELLASHRQLLSLFSGQKLVIEAFKNTPADPLAAILAAQAGRNLNQELKLLLEELYAQ